MTNLPFFLFGAESLLLMIGPSFLGQDVTRLYRFLLWWWFACLLILPCVTSAYFQSGCCNYQPFSFTSKTNKRVLDFKVAHFHPQRAACLSVFRSPHFKNWLHAFRICVAVTVVRTTSPFVLPHLDKKSSIEPLQHRTCPNISWNNGDFSFSVFCFTKLVHFKCFVLLSNNIDILKLCFPFFTASAFIRKIKSKLLYIFGCFVIFWGIFLAGKVIQKWSFAVEH